MPKISVHTETHIVHTSCDVVVSLLVSPRSISSKVVALQGNKCALQSAARSQAPDWSWGRPAKRMSCSIESWTPAYFEAEEVSTAGCHDNAGLMCAEAIHTLDTCGQAAGCGNSRLAQSKSRIAEMVQNKFPAALCHAKSAVAVDRVPRVTGSGCLCFPLQHMGAAAGLIKRPRKVF